MHFRATYQACSVEWKRVTTMLWGLSHFSLPFQEWTKRGKENLREWGGKTPFSRLSFQGMTPFSRKCRRTLFFRTIFSLDASSQASYRKTCRSYRCRETRSDCIWLSIICLSFTSSHIHTQRDVCQSDVCVYAILPIVASMCHPASHLHTHTCISHTEDTSSRHSHTSSDVIWTPILTHEAQNPDAVSLSLRPSNRYMRASFWTHPCDSQDLESLFSSCLPFRHLGIRGMQ